MPLLWQAWQHISRRHGFYFTEDRLYSLGGVPTRDILKMINVEQGLSLDIQVVAHEKETVYIERLPLLKPIPSVVAIAREHLGRIPMAVASGGVKKTIEKVLGHLGIREWFDAIVTSEDVSRQKPAPDIFLKAAWQIGCATSVLQGL